MKLGLGTAQFGMHYGISNPLGQLNQSEIRAILHHAHLHQVNVIDTAASYGESEAVLGAELSTRASHALVTKISGSPDELLSVCGESLSRLRQPAVYGVLLHRADDLLQDGADALYAALCQLKKRGYAKKIGVSAYYPKQLHSIIKRYPIDLVQLPLSVFDQRFLKSGLLEILKNQSIEIHARSIFLQGLLLMKPDHLPNFFEPIRVALQRFQEAVHALNFSLTEAAFHFVNALPEVDAVICGVNSLVQFQELVALAHMPERSCDFSEFALNEDRFLIPSYWEVNAQEALK